MTNLLDSAVNLVSTKMASHLATTVSYEKFGGNGEFEITATMGQTLMREDRGDVVTRWRSRDFLVKKADLLDPVDGAFEPAENDIITVAGEDYRVGTRNPGEDVWVPMDPAGTLIRIRTELVPPRVEEE